MARAQTTSGKSPPTTMEGTPCSHGGDTMFSGRGHHVFMVSPSCLSPSCLSPSGRLFGHALLLEDLPHPLGSHGDVDVLHAQVLERVHHRVDDHLHSVHRRRLPD